MPVEAFTPTLLITDDDVALRQTLRDAFEPRGFATKLAADGDEALEVVQHNQIHLVLLDLHMPRLSGLETLRLMRELPVRAPLAILMSSAIDERVEREALAMGVFSVLPKPFRFAHLATIVREALARSYDWSPPV
jgi:DNA-binding response OmpR family regulator